MRCGPRLARAQALGPSLLLVLVLLGCGGGGGGEPTLTGETFIAFPRDFAGFEAWTAFDLGADQDDGVMAVGHRRAYINQLPATGSASFPVGTIIVKTIGEGEAEPGQTFAMVKRNAGYNARGALGWEWFELLATDAAVAPLILWRGITPPAGEKYAGVAGGACNSCHMLGQANDYVPSAELQLTEF